MRPRPRLRVYAKGSKQPDWVEQKMAKSVNKSKSNNELLYEHALAAIQELFGDTSVPHEETRIQLQGLRDELDILIDAAK